MLINLTPHALLFTIAAFGISETAYLIRKRQAAERPVCPIGEGCETVLNSQYNKMFFGVHNEIFGLLFYAFFAALAAILVIGSPYNDIFTMVGWAMLIPATLFSLVLIFLQWRVLRAWCFWCVMSAVTVGLMDLMMFWLVNL